jgi:hypothetical protein
MNTNNISTQNSRDKENQTLKDIDKGVTILEKLVSILSTVINIFKPNKNK